VLCAIHSTSPDGVAALIELLKDRNSAIRQQAVQALRLIDAGAEGAVGPLIGLLKDEPKIRDEAVRTLGGIGASAVPALLGALKDANLLVRRGAAKALGSMQPCPREAVRPLVGLLNGEPEVREAAAEALGALGRPALAMLFESLKDSDRLVREGAAKALGLFRRGPPEAVRPLVGLLKDRRAVREAAAAALARIGSPAHAALLAALKDSDPLVRQGAAKALSVFQLGPPEAFGPLVKLLKDEEPEVRSMAAVALKRSFPQRAVAPLMEALKDRNPGVRSNAATGLQWLGPDAKAAVPALVEALKDNNTLVRIAAGLALKKIDPEAAKCAGVKD
jgi:HEAT repeat protein